MHQMTSGSPDPGTTSPSAIAYRCSTLAVFTSHQISRRLPNLYPLKADAFLAKEHSASPCGECRRPPPSATSFDRLLALNGSRFSAGLDLAIFLISRRFDSVNVLGHPPAYLG
jgi:hypothetical protein